MIIQIFLVHDGAFIDFIVKEIVSLLMEEECIRELIESKEVKVNAVAGRAAKEPSTSYDTSQGAV